jgi:phosphate transport system substrate-binding protein
MAPRLALYCLAAAAVCAACGTSGPVETVTMDGSSTVFPLSEAVALDFMKVNRNTRVNLTFSGTVVGFQKFCRGQLDVVNASRPITPTEQAQCEMNNVVFVELPVAYDGLTVIVHPRNEWATAMTVPELRTLWEPGAEGKIVKWSQLRPGWPDREIHLFAPGPESGTFDYFTDVIVGGTAASRKDYTASSDDQQIVERVASDEQALGYVGYGYFERNRNRLKAVPVDDLEDSIGRGPIEPSLENIARGVYRPLSRPLFIYTALQPLQRAAVKEFVAFYLRNAGDLAAQVGTVAMTPPIYKLTQQRLATGITGTMYVAPNAANTSVELLLRQ